MSLRSYALCGLAAPVIFVSAIVVFAALRPDYSHLLLWVLIMAMALWRRTGSRGASSVESAARLTQGI